MKPIKIVGFGRYLPQRVPSSEIEARHGLPPGWSERYSGVATRHHVTTESNGYMGARALEKALAAANCTLADLDLLISASATTDYPIPNGASVIKSELPGGEAAHTACIDIDATCLSFVSAFEFAAHLMGKHGYQRVAIVSSEIASIGLAPEQWEILTLFGDGAAAAILEYAPTAASRFVKGALCTYSEGVYDTMIPAGGTRNWKKAVDPQLYNFAMKGKNLLRMAYKRLPEFLDRFFADLPYNMDDLDVIVPHQASKSGIDMFQSLFNLPAEKIKGNLATHGNCIAASIPLSLYDHVENGEIQRGDLCLLLGTSAGFSIGAVLIAY